MDFIVRRNNKAKLHIAPLQGTTANQFLREYNFKTMSTVVYARNGKIFSKSSAVLWILNDLGRAWPLLMVFMIVPPFIRNAVYDFVAKRRYRWFGKRETCRIPLVEEREYFLD